MTRLCALLTAGLMIGVFSIVSVGSRGDAAKEFPTTPAADECVISPRSMADLILLAGGLTPVAADDSQLSVDDQPAMSDLVKTLMESVACINANSPLQWLALFSDRYVAERFGPEAPDALGSLQTVLTRSPDPALPRDQLSIAAIERGDSDSVLVVTTTNANATFVDEIAFTLEDGRWLIDRVKPVDEREN